MFEKFNTFIQVVESAGFSKAAKSLGLSKPTVTRYISDLEDFYNAKLLHRTTRHVSLTEQGEVVYQYALQLTQLNLEAQERVGNAAECIQGTVKIGLPFSILFQFCTKALKSLMDEYPALQFNIIHGNHLQDLLSSHYDLIVHCGPLPNVAYYYEHIADWRVKLCAAPEYLKKHGTPKNLEALAKHDLLDHSDNYKGTWPLKSADKNYEFPVNSKLRVSCGILLKELSIMGYGISCLPSFIVDDAILSKQLKPILKQHWSDTLPVYAIYPLKKEYNRKVAVVIEQLKKCFHFE